jgi:hypothetical protein
LVFGGASELARESRPANDPPPDTRKTLIRRLAPFSLASLGAGSFTPFTASLAEPAVEHDDHVRRLRECRAEVIVNMPILA